MNKEERKKYIFAQLNSLPNAFQYVEVTNYINSLESETTNLKQALNEIRELVIEHEDLEKNVLLDYALIRGTILQIIDKARGDDDSDRTT